MHPAGALLLLLATCVFLVHTSRVCDTCKCEEGRVNCTNLNLSRHFEESEWPNATDMTITGVKFDYNSLVHVTEFPELSVTYLSFAHNQIVRIDKASFKNLKNLTELDLSHNYLTSANLFSDVFKGVYLPDEYLPLHNLKVLRLGSNAIHSLQQNLFEHVPNLKVLTLDENPFIIIDFVTMVAINSLVLLEELDLSYTQLSDLPDILHTPDKLHKLSLMGNNFTKVPSALMHSHALEELDFSNNPISVLNQHNSFNGLDHLRVLRLSYMRNLSSVEVGALWLPSLEELYMSHNFKLKHIHPNALKWRANPQEVEQWAPIKKLDLSHNELGSVDRQLLAHWDTLEYLNLAQNPWSCECENQWMVSTLLPTVGKSLEDQNLTCYVPIQMRNRKLTELEVRHYHMRCLDTRGNHPEKDAKMLVGVLIGVLVAVPLTIAAILLIRRTGIGANLFRSRGQNDYSKAFYSRADSVEHF
ncbi:hypothetical protein C0J52_22955 [Blattella germanica]|nr:hypothetical protein C0J52_22955 [Blattella germanica]